MNNPKIEKNIPVQGIARRWESLLRTMEVGDSVFFTDPEDANSLATSIRNRRHHASCRRVSGGYRVWKLERYKP